MPSRPTLSSFRAQWPSEATGVCQSDPQVAVYCNDSQDRLLIDPLCPDEGWAYGWVKMNFNVSALNGAAYVTAPQEIVRLIVADVCKHPIRIRNGFFEYLTFNIGLQPKNCQGQACGGTFQAYERDNVATLTELVGTKTIRIYPSDPRDLNLQVLLQGKDSNGMPILTTDPNTGTSAPGEYVRLAFPFVDSVNQFSTITGVLKDQTFGPVQLFQIDPSSGAETPLSSLEPNEGTGWYRRYLISGIPSVNLCCTPSNPIQISAQARLGFVPVENENDFLTIQCVPALIEEALSIRYSRMEQGQTLAAQHHLRALSLLTGQLDAIYGKTNTAVAVPIFGSNRMRHSFI